MPMITVEFTDDEFVLVSARAASLGKSVGAHGHDVIVGGAQRAGFPRDRPEGQD
ncbi:hypothetical protein [Streptomyces sp. NPDC050704]|uniref:hypothetical protein n=1 Tax=Streptomyces sp. NPDC050704 TaxID=3157219 RepID=UPI00341D49C0